MRGKTRMARAIPFIVGLTIVALVPAGPANAASDLSLEESRTEQLVRMVDGARATFGGVSVDEATGTLTVRYAKGAGEAAARARFGGLTTRKAPAKGQRWRVQFAPVSHSLAELYAVRQTVAADRAWLSGAGVTEYYTDIERNLVAVGVEKLSAELQAQAGARFGDLVRLHTAARPDALSTRLDDFEPWVAGSRIVSGDRGCTGGFVIRTDVFFVPVRWLVTAGHCFAEGATVTNNGDAIGTVVSRTFTNNGLDVEYVGGQTYEAWTYKGPPTSDYGDAIRGPRISLVGRSYCTNGATSGEICSGTVDAIDLCVLFDDGVTRCSLDRMRGGVTLSRRGDSGGNVFAYDSAGLKIGGIIIGGLGTTTYFHSYHYLIPPGWQLDAIA
jgi:hypothetical protein